MRRSRREALRLAKAAALSAAMLLPSGCRAQQNWPLWNSYTARYLDGQGRVIDHDASDRSTTEGEAYAMFFALVNNDQARFDKLVDWTETNMAQGDLTLHLPGWSWGKAPDGSWRVLDQNSASDADLWMAYALCEAGRLWHVDRYARLGAIMADRIAHEEIVLVPSVGTVLVPGTTGFHPSPLVWFVNPSYTPPALVAYFAHRSPASPWEQVLETLPTVAQTSGGFAMDWMTATTDAGVAPSAPPSVVAALQPGQAAPAPVGSYDAIRVYLWAGMADPHTPHLRALLAALPGMSKYLASSTTPPLKAGPEGQVLDPNSPVGFSAAVIPYLDVLGRKQEQKIQIERIGALLDPKTGLYGHEGQYYDQNLALFEDGWSSGRFSFDAQGRLHVKWKQK